MYGVARRRFVFLEGIGLFPLISAKIGIFETGQNVGINVLLGYNIGTDRSLKHTTIGESQHGDFTGVKAI